MSFKTLTVILASMLICAPAWAKPSGGTLVLPIQSIAKTSATTVLEPTADAWTSAKPTRLHLNLTPPLYAGDATDDGFRPEVSVQLLRLADGSVVVRSQWIDPTANRTGDGATFPDGGEVHIYKKHSSGVGTFPDAFCVMVPVKRGPHVAYPSMMMGEKKKPVDLFFWKAGSGFKMLGAHGRASTKETKTTLVGKSVRKGDHWTVTMVLPHMEPGTPVCFAIWDGAKEQRDGIKYYSLWYEVE
jgi:hypothetical protein